MNTFIIINSLVFIVFIFAKTLLKAAADDSGKPSVEEEMYGVKYANECEVCKYVVIELSERLKETGRSHDVIETGYSLFDESKKKKTKYTKSELRLVDSLDNVCESFLNYNIHKERKNSHRFDKGMSQTFKALHDLVDRGVKVELGIPYELWDKPSAEITHLKTQCEQLLEKHEEDISDWYWNHQDADLLQFLCVERALKKGDSSCLYEDQTRVKDEL
ncbi:Protein canopy 4-like protein [Dinothrombium tinctorium]|uniref:Protein canopy 4-like protein n=1 Tax=Dinothrombium tinctorium TaxID=1965070 RepID=A0A3S4QFV5_9ACAR|nr:Protein canopy 4-like protein [Dinothrombium tinctorium]RWS02934.1 Protein canopy 4-like protein [Dinothrombium tinctorium]RWS02981.1 Protein canopy 4-like protein [Dinothrombium tinctorium]RWS11966.1 Protein canopy 4-like protein [Dinothrombium tinctorium]